MNRNDFPIFNNNLIYFDNGATTQKPKVVIDTMTSYYSDYCSNCHRGDYKNSLLVDDKYEETRKLVKEFINAEKMEEIVFTSGTTESLNMIVNGFFDHLLKEGDEVILTVSEHASNLLPWFNLSRKKGIVIKYIPLDDNYYVTLENLKKVVSDKTKVISLAVITNVIGDLRPMDEIIKYAHSKDIFVVGDASQSVGHIKTDVRSSGIDFLAFSGHKMYGPTGVGVLYGKYELLNNLFPTNLGGGMNESFESDGSFNLKSLPTRLEAGTPNISGVIGLGSAIKYLNSIGLDKIKTYENDLRKYLLDELIKIPHVDIINIEADAPIVSFNIDGIFSQDVAIYLDKYNVCVRAGNHCAKMLKNAINVKNTLRVSLSFYNTFEEIDELIELLRNRDRIIKEML